MLRDTLGIPARARITAESDSCQCMWREPSYDIREQKIGHHYYTLRVSAAALTEGAAWARRIAASTCEAPRRR